MNAVHDLLFALLLIVVVHLALLAIPAWIWVNYRWDRNRVKTYIEEGGGQLLSFTWTMDTPQHLFNYDGFARIYSVQFLNSAGERRQAICQTNWASGVYLTEEIEVCVDGNTPRGSLDVPQTVVSLEAEIERLRIENAVLRGDKSNKANGN